MDELLVLIPFYRASDELEEGFLDRVLSTMEAAKRTDVTVLALDDASPDNTLTQLRKYQDRDQIEIYAHETNTDYDGAMNDLIRIGTEQFDPDAYLFYSQDATISTSAIDTLLERMVDAPQLGILQPLVEDDADGIYSFGHRYGDDYMCYPIQRDRPVREPWSAAAWIERPSVSLLGTVVRQAVFDDIGILDERFEHYWESSDICYRARRAGWDVGVTTDARATHDRYLSESTPDHLYYTYRNWPLFWAKYDTTISDRILEEFWPTSLTEFQNITDVSSEITDLSFLDRAREDAFELREQFIDSKDFGFDQLDPTRARHISR